MIKRAENTYMTEQGLPFQPKGIEWTSFKPQKTSEDLGPKLEAWNKEWQEIKEKDWEVDFGLLSISGKPGSGTSSTAKILASLYQAELYKAGDTIRELAGATDRTRSIKRDPIVDSFVDGTIREKVSAVKKGKPVIVEAQIGGATVLETIQYLKREGNYPDATIIRILFWATKEERVKRLKLASDASVDEKQNKLALLLEGGTNEEVNKALGDEIYEKFGELEIIEDKELKQEAEKKLGEYAKIHHEGTVEEKRKLLMILGESLRKKSYDQIYKETTEREKNDLLWWKQLYPDLIGEDNPLEKNAKDAKGNYIYTTPAFDNTDWGTPERTAYEVHNHLVELGQVRPKTQMWLDRPLFLGYEPEDNLFEDRLWD